MYAKFSSVKITIKESIHCMENSSKHIQYVKNEFLHLRKLKHLYYFNKKKIILFKKNRNSFFIYSYY